MKYVLPLRHRLAGDRSLSGGKGVGLHWLIRRGYRVPDGLIVTSEGFHQFALESGLREIVNLELAKVSPRNHATLARAATNIQKQILGATLPPAIEKQLASALSGSRKRFAIRSSAAFEDSGVQSWAGQFDSYLDIAREEVPKYLKRCWASLYNVRAMTYLYETYTGYELPRYAVVVQEMVQSEVAGVTFSIDPQTGKADRVVIEAVYGFGDHMVSGRRLSSSVIVNKRNGILIGADRRIRDLVLRPGQLKRLRDDIVQMEERFSVPVDVEWALAKRRFWYLQIRPVTAVSKGSNSTIKPVRPDIDNYELTFKVHGLTFLLTSVLAIGFRYLDPLFTSAEDGAFAQYFTKVKMDYAARYGERWFAKPGSVLAYTKAFTNYYRKNLLHLDTVRGQLVLSRADVIRVFRIITTCFTYYSKSDNEFTDAAFSLKRRTRWVSTNLRLLAEFKDIARLWINMLVIDENSYLTEFCVKLENQFAVDRSDLEFYSVKEIIALFDGFRVDPKEVASRRKSYCMYYLDRRLVHLAGLESSKFIAQIADKTRSLGGSEVKGRVANGDDRLVTGRAMVISVDYGQIGKMNAAISKMKQGDVLIADFTAPELIEACRKATAIVTDIGGLLSHAAIVSRELELPCIVGTVNATQVFKTGDHVEVDCRSGLVRLSKAARSSPKRNSSRIEESSA